MEKITIAKMMLVEMQAIKDYFIVCEQVIETEDMITIVGVEEHTYEYLRTQPLFKRLPNRTATIKTDIVRFCNVHILLE